MSCTDTFHAFLKKLAASSKHFRIFDRTFIYKVLSFILVRFLLTNKKEMVFALATAHFAPNSCEKKWYASAMREGGRKLCIQRIRF